MAMITRPGRPLVATLLALAATILSLWYMLLGARAMVLFVAEIVFASPAPVDEAVRFGPLLLAVASFIAMLWGFVTSSGLFGGAAWAPISAVLLALFALPFGFPTDLILTVAVLVLLLVPSGARQFFW